MDYTDYENKIFSEMENFRTYLNVIKFHLQYKYVNEGKNDKQLASLISHLEDWNINISHMIDNDFFTLDNDVILDIKNKYFDDIDEIIEKM